MAYKLNMAARSITYRKRQYIPLLIVCAIGIAISVFCVFIVRGMLSALESKARIYYGGDFMIWSGKSGDGKLETPCVYEIIEEMRPSFPKGSIITPRFSFDFDEDTTSFYFEGVSAIQRIIQGVNFNLEHGLLSQFTFVSGGIDNIAGTNGLLISEPIAKKLGVKVGDEIILMTRTSDNFLNTIPLSIHGIFRDSSLFGAYTSYMDIDFLREACDMPSDWANRICIQLPREYNPNKIGHTINEKLGKTLSMFPYEKTKYDFRNYKKTADYKGIMHKLVPLQENLSDVDILVDAMNAVTLFAIVMLLIIIAAGVSSAYRVIIMKRINEIGIYMAIGMRRAEIAQMILSETLILMVAGSFCGMILSLVFCQILSQFNLSFIPAFDIFLINGVIKPAISPAAFIVVVFTVCVTTIVAVLFSIRKSVQMAPVEALGVTE